MFNKKQKRLSQVAPAEENGENAEVVLLDGNTTGNENQPHQQQSLSSKGPPQTPKKRKSVFKRIMPFLGTLSKPRTTELETAQLIKFRGIIQDTHDKYRQKKEAKRKKREQKKAMEKEHTSRHFWPFRFENSKTNLKGSDGVIRKLDKDPSITSAFDAVFLMKETKPLNTTMSTDEVNYLRYLQQQQSGPTHVSAKSSKDEHSKRMERKQRRKLSYFYEGDDAYHHSLSRYWDHKEGSRFFTMLDREKRKKYPITNEIQEKLEKIKIARQRKVNRQSQKNCHNKFQKWCANIFRRTTLGQVFRNTPRYYQLRPEIPKRCRRCRYLLVDTLESRWTPLGITFAILFPIIGILCCIVNREFVCVVCEEIYVYGDYPSRCKPLDKENEDSDFDMRADKKFKSRPKVDVV